MTKTPKRTDVGFITIVMLVLAVVTWLLLTPVVPAVSLATMRRFHLGSESFARWAVQFPIPAMYNFANTYQVQELPPGMVDPIVQEQQVKYLNHFTARAVTFADARFYHLRQGKDRWFTLTTDYRGRHLESRWYLKRNGRNFVLRRLDAQESP